MKQTVLAIMAFLFLVSIYAVYLGVKDSMQTQQPPHMTAIKSPETPLKAKEIPPKEKVSVKKKVYKAPRSTPESKRQFLKKTIAAITKVKNRLDAQFDMVYKLSLKESLTPQERETLEKLKKRYHVKGIPCLLKRLHTHPVSIVIAQAALETGWGSSRFYREANNIFGVWSFNKNEPRMAAGVKRDGKKTIYVKKYKNLEASIEGYYRMMAMGRAYKTFRDVRLHTDNPFEIIPFLDHYSELRHEYVKRLYYVIKSNKFYELDDPQYQPPGWSHIKAADPKYLLSKNKKPAAKIAQKCQKDTADTLTQKSTDTNISRIENIKLIEETNSTIPVKELESEINSVLDEKQADTNDSKQDLNDTTPLKALEKEVDKAA